MVKTCFICGKPALRLDEASGEPLCARHSEPRTEARFELRRHRNLVQRAWDMLSDIRAWHAGSAYAADQAMARRLEGVRR